MQLKGETSGTWTSTHLEVNVHFSPPTCFQGFQTPHAISLQHHASLLFGSPATQCFPRMRPFRGFFKPSPRLSLFPLLVTSANQLLLLGGALTVPVIQKDPSETKNCHKTYPFSVLWNRGFSVCAQMQEKRAQENCIHARCFHSRVFKKK